MITVTADSSFVYGLTSDVQIKIAGTCVAYFDCGRSDISQWSKQERILALAGNLSGSVAAVTESGELKIAGAISGDSDTICESWNHSIRPLLSEHAEELMYKVIKNHGKTVQAYQLGSDSSVIQELIRSRKIIPLNNDKYEVFSQEVLQAGAEHGQIASHGD